MAMRGKLCVMMAAALAASVAVQAEERPQASAIDRAQDSRSAVLLAAHNAERARLDLPVLRWDDRLAEDARHWATQLAREGRMRHASQVQRNNAGENLWMGTKGYFGAEVMVNTFIAERRYFRPGRFPDVSTTGDWRDVGHYTQVIWRDTEAVGCAIAEGPREEFLVCRYWPAGNWWGRPVY